MCVRLCQWKDDWDGVVEHGVRVDRRMGKRRLTKPSSFSYNDKSSSYYVLLLI